MSRKRRRQTPVSTPTPQPQKTDARREVAARAVKALRSAEAAKLRVNLIQVYNSFHPTTRRVSHEQIRTRNGRPPSGQSVSPYLAERRLPSVPELRRSRLPSQVRHQLQDGIRALACNSRRTRREVIFALRRAGKNGKGNKRAKWTTQSRIRCK